MLPATDIEPRLVRITEPSHRHYEQIAYAEAVFLLGDWTEPRFRLRFSDGTISTATKSEIRELPPELSD